MALNPKGLPVGSIGYFLVHKNGLPTIDFGLVEEHYVDTVCLRRLELRRDITIDGVPVSEIDFPTRYRKLPKGWTYDTELFKYEERLPKEAGFIPINDPNALLDALHKGILVESVYHYKYESYITKDGWFIQQVADSDDSGFYVTVPFDQCFATYDEAYEVCHAITNEFHIQAALSDEEWSVEQIDKDLVKYQTIYSKSNEEMTEIRKFIMSIPHIEDVETRVAYNEIQWKYWKNKRWNSIVL